MNDKNCPKCQSEKILWLAEPKVFICTLCVNQWSDVKVLTEQLFCKALSESDDWQWTVLNEYPAPIAHEYKQLQKVLKQGQFVSAMLQLKDVVEVIVKFSAINMYQWLSAQNFINDSEEFNIVSTELLSKPLSLGTWLSILRNVSYLILSNNDNSNYDVGSRVASWLYSYQEKQEGRKEKFQPTSLTSWLNRMVEWRNKEIGHGALRIDYSEQFKEFEKLINELHALLGKENPWGRYQLFLVNGSSNADRLQMTGWESIKKRHESLSPFNASLHRIDSNKLLLVNKDNPEQVIELSPFIEAKVCTYCNLKDVFIFDGVAKNRYFCIDYLSGHRLKLATDKNKNLIRILSRNNFVKFDAKSNEEQTVDQDSISESLLNVFEMKSLELEANYTPPIYLNNLISDYLNDDAYDSGLFWLQAPAHMGKSTFIKGLNDKSLGGKFIILRFHISREYRYFAHHFTEHLYIELQKELAKRSGNKPLPRIDLQDISNTPDNMLVNWVNEIWDCRPQKLQNHTLIIAIDGLDEVGRPKEDDFTKLSIVDLLPTKNSNKLNNNIYIVLTSRPIKDCPYWMQGYLKQKLSDNTYQVIINKDDKGYLSVLRDHFNSNLKKLLKDVPKKYHNDIFEMLLDKSDALFLYFSMLIEQISSQQLSLADLDKLPYGKELYGYFIDKLEYVLGENSKGFLAIKDIITLLTACEQAFYTDISIQTEAMQIDGESIDLGYSPSWQGIDASTLAGLLNEAHGAYSSQFIFSLFTIKSLMRVERSSEQAKYKIGLKELNSYINKRWKGAVKEWHKRLSIHFYEPWIDAYDYDYLNGYIVKNDGNRIAIDLEDNSIPDINYLNRYALSHAKIASEAGIFFDTNYYNKIIESNSIRSFFHHNYLINELDLFARRALSWLNMEIFCQENTQSVKNKLKCYQSDNLKYQVNEVWTKLATNYLNRGDLLSYMEHEDYAQLNYNQTAILSRADIVSSYDNKVILLLESLSRSNKFSKLNGPLIDGSYNDELTEAKLLLIECLEYLDSMKLHAEAYNSKNLMQVHDSLQWKIELMGAKVLSQEIKLSESDRYYSLYQGDSIGELCETQSVYEVYRKSITYNKNLKYELVNQYLKLSDCNGIGEKTFYDMNSAVVILREIIGSYKDTSPLKYQYSLAQTLRSRLSHYFLDHSDNSKITKDTIEQKDILESIKNKLESKNEYVPKLLEDSLLKTYEDIRSIHDVTSATTNYVSQNYGVKYDSYETDVKPALESIGSLINIKLMEKERLIEKYINDDRDSSRYSLMKWYGSYLDLLGEKLSILTSKRILDEEVKEASYIVDTINEIFQREILFKRDLFSLQRLLIENKEGMGGNEFLNIDINFINKVLSLYIECASVYLRDDKNKKAEFIISLVDCFYEPLILEERNRYVAFKLDGFNDQSDEEFFKWRDAYSQCISGLNYYDDDLDIEYKGDRVIFTYMSKVQNVLNSILYDKIGLLDVLKKDKPLLNFSRYFHSNVLNIRMNVRYMFDCRQDEYGSLEGISDLKVLISNINYLIEKEPEAVEKVSILCSCYYVYTSIVYFYKDIHDIDSAIEYSVLFIERLKEFELLLEGYENNKTVSASRISILEIKQKMLLVKAGLYTQNLEKESALNSYNEFICIYEGFLRNPPVILGRFQSDFYKRYGLRYLKEIDKALNVSIELQESLNSPVLASKAYTEIKLFQLNYLIEGRYSRDRVVSFRTEAKGIMPRLYHLQYWERVLFESKIRNDIKLAEQKDYLTKSYFAYISDLDGSNWWFNIATKSASYVELDNYDYCQYIDILTNRAQTISYTDTVLAIEEYSKAIDVCCNYLDRKNACILINIKSRIAVLFFCRATAYESLGDKVNLELGLVDYSESIAQLEYLRVYRVDKRGYGESNDLNQFLLRVYFSRAMLHNKVRKKNLAQQDFESVTSLHYQLYFSKIIYIEHQIDWFLQGMIFVNDDGTGFYDSKNIEMSNIKNPIELFLYPIYENDATLYEVLENKFKFSQNTLVEIRNNNDYTFVSNMLHSLGNAFVICAIKSNRRHLDLLLLILDKVENVYEEIKILNNIDPVRSASEILETDVIKAGFLLEKNGTNSNQAYSYYKIAQRIHLQAIEIMRDHSYVYPELWDYDLRISTQLASL
ncbi:hypothetical protein [Psychrobacter sp. DAB_AL32B]|uniref:hypothetical protein n=1 Tax=Psychrobacter sp. DAB_AL32B TaxID=1028414 RepID=UPI000B7DE369|nr:hypothetical protein [Psychrobacter sp. DAB_AL32B]OXL24678.1 hypothetical protein CAN34_05420 [Psychrobacter sp. DAB_AL32B]